ncbi:RodZ family helix-turn-helix domain-containing protein [Polynucleobacter sp. JS-JIR-II-50]|uniref:helix-turn-helix domain-containing protein n=1 Tax=Polynucleobacter sp. JS-JIR-II-50 TaxID=2576919 RepID=UPI001BFE667F|nr:helix-turn-helix domain-containing protein [Polynucleobacter sp. JS-JIR-II-50]QWE03896.1 helix-turn-helix domain-containing protein [Polynucleobacter sp. JS-JIR-II-50]
MNKSVKLPEIRKEAFTKARESLGLSTKDLSGMTCLSVRQVEQIENGETSSFYGDQVKFTAAKKVAGLLKLAPEEAFDFSGVAQPIKASDVEEKLQEETKASLLEKKAKSEKEKEISPVAAEKVAEPKPEKMNASKISQKAIDYSEKSKAPVDPKKKLFLLLAIGAALVFSVVNLRPLFFPEPVKEEVVIIQEVAQEPVPANAAAEAVTETKPAPAAVEPTPVVVTAECPPADASALNYRPEAPKKAGDMVYLQSKTAQTVCVVDATGKTQNKTLEPGVGMSVYGKSPLKVLTSGLNQVDLYYQGAKVRIGNTSSKTIILEPAEIIQPAAPANSTDSQLR